VLRKPLTEGGPGRITPGLRRPGTAGRPLVSLRETLRAGSRDRGSPGGGSPDTCETMSAGVCLPSRAGAVPSSTSAPAVGALRMAPRPSRNGVRVIMATPPGALAGGAATRQRPCSRYCRDGIRRRDLESTQQRARRLRGWPRARRAAARGSALQDRETCARRSRGLARRRTLVAEQRSANPASASVGAAPFRRGCGVNLAPGASARGGVTSRLLFVACKAAQSWMRGYETCTRERTSSLCW
jgi:hypothetical protein